MSKVQSHEWRFLLSQGSETVAIRHYGSQENGHVHNAEEESSSDRIQAVNYVESIEIPDENVIEALVKTLNNDKNVNVRMAAAYALSKFSI